MLHFPPKSRTELAELSLALLAYSRSVGRFVANALANTEYGMGEMTALASTRYAMADMTADV